MNAGWIEYYNPVQELEPEQALELIRHIINDGEVIYSSHARERMIERNFTISDILLILQKGKLAEKQYEENKKNWKYTIQGADIDGDEGTIVTAIISNRKQLIVTVF